MHRKFFFQQNDEGVLILEPFSWSNVIFEICFFCIKSHDWCNEEFLWVPSPDCNTAELCNECFSLFMLSSFYKERANALPGGAKQWKFSVRQLWLLRQKWQILKMTLPQKNSHRIQTPSSKLMILVSSCWKKNFIRNNGHSLFILSLVFLKSLIVSVAFFLGHPVYGQTVRACTCFSGRGLLQSFSVGLFDRSSIHW